METKKHYRVLTIDDTPALHEDYKKILTESTGSLSLLRDMEASLFGDTSRFKRSQIFEIECAFQGEEGVKLLRRGLTEGKPFALAFVDMRMPPGWDGLQTIEELWKVDPTLQVVLCTAYSDNTWEDICRRVGNSDNLAILKKPFDSIEVYQLCFAMTRKWEMARQARHHIDDLNRLIAQRTRDLEISNDQLQREVSQRSRLEIHLPLAQSVDTLGQVAKNLASQFLEILSEIEVSGKRMTDAEPLTDAQSKANQAVIQASRKGASMARRLMALGNPSPTAPQSIPLKQALTSHRVMFDGVLGGPLQWEWVLAQTEPEPNIYTDETALMRLLLGLELQLRNRQGRSEHVFLQVTRVHREIQRTGGSRSSTAGDFLCITVAQHSTDRATSSGSSRSAGTSTAVLLPGDTVADPTLAELCRHADQCHGWVEKAPASSDGALLQIYLPSTAESYANRAGTPGTSHIRATKAA